MAILAVQYKGKTAAPGDQAPPPSFSSVLRKGGPRIQVYISPADQVTAQLIKKGIPVPPPILGMALIDTGASISCIDVDAATQLSLPILDVVKMNSASHAGYPANVYPVKFEMVGSRIKINIPMAVGAPLGHQKLVGLIGRDILSRCHFVYDGLLGQIVLAL